MAGTLMQPSPARSGAGAGVGPAQRTSLAIGWGSGRCERGSASVFLVVVAAGLLAMVALVVDGGGRIAALIEADRAAAGAARAAGQAIDATAVMAGRPVAADPLAAAAAARRHLSAVGVAGEVSVAPGGLAVDVVARTTYQPVFLGLLGVGSLPVAGSARAELFQLGGGASG